MNPLPITTRQVVRMVSIFVGVILAFGVLSAIVGWPNAQSWGTVVLAALVLALVPMVSPVLAFLQESGAVVEVRGVKLDWSRAPRPTSAEPRRANLDENPGLQVTDSNAASIAEVASTAMDAEIVVVDLGTGRSWYPSRLFALAAAADILVGPRAIVLLAQRGGTERALSGWLHPSDVVRAMTQENPRYGEALKRAKAILRQLELNVDTPAPTFPPHLTSAYQFTLAYQTQGEMAFVPALISELQQDQSAINPAVPSPPIEDPHYPRYLNREDAERLFDPWLFRERLRLTGADRENPETLARVSERYVPVVDDRDRYVGMVDIDAYVRRLVLSPPDPAAAPQRGPQSLSR